MNQEAFGKLIGVGISGVSDYETGKAFPRPTTLKNIVEAGNVSYDWLLRPERTIDEPQSPNADRASDSAAAAGAVNETVLSEAIRAMELFLAKNNAILDPMKKAEAISLLYEIYMKEGGRESGEETIGKIFRLAS